MKFKITALANILMAFQANETNLIVRNQMTNVHLVLCSHGNMINYERNSYVS